MTAYLLKVVSILLQYGMLLFLLLFVARLTRCMFRDIRGQRTRIAASSHSSEGKASLTIVSAGRPELQGRRFVFGKEITIGRGADNDIVLPENFVSHHHLVIYQHQNLYMVKDLGSMNTAQVNGIPLVNQTYLRNGDQIQVGLVTLKFER